MLIVSVIAGVCLLSAMSYLALSKKIVFRLRIAALIALGVMILALIVCLIVLLSGGALVSGGLVSGESGIPVDLSRGPEYSWLLLGSVIFLIALFVFIALMSMREHGSRKL